MSRYKIALRSTCVNSEADALVRIATILAVPKESLKIDATRRHAGTVSLTAHNLTREVIQRIQAIDTVLCIRREE